MWKGLRKWGLQCGLGLIVVKVKVNVARSCTAYFSSLASIDFYNEVMGLNHTTFILYIYLSPPISPGCVL